MQIFVDADACPVVDIVETIAEKYNIKTTLLCDTNHVLYSDYSEVIVVGAGADAVDYKLISLCHRGDIVVSQDYGVAAMALGMTACGSKSEGKISTNDTSANGTSHTAVSAGVDWTGYDELVDSIRTEADLAKRAEMMHQAEDMLMDTWCVIPLYYYNDQYMLKDYVTGVYSTVEGMKYFYNAKNTKNAGKLNIFMASEPDHIDPALNSTVDGGCLAVNSFEGLMRYNAEGKLEPACAESYEVSEDGLTYTFTMRDGLKWSNGDELTAKDFEWSWRRAADPKTAADYSYLCAVFAGYDDTKGLAADDVVASDDGKTLTVKLKAVTPYFLDLCAFPFFFPVNQKSVEGNDDWANDASDKFVTNGAFTLKEWKHDSSMLRILTTGMLTM